VPPLPSDLRKELDKAVVRARDTAEQGAANAMAVLGVAAGEAPAGLTPEQRALRFALRAHARALGREVAQLGLDELREEIAYGAWHRMLFARFLAENGLLVHPGSGAPVSMADVEELAQDEGEADPWVVAARYAADILPGIFGTTDPTTKVTLAPDDRLRLEAILKELPREVFTADDALGWVYQFWQSKRKKEVNAKGDKIGGADLAPVTQLFTEHYMVRFLLENSLGAWWAGRHPDSPLLRTWEYLRYRDDGTPAAGTFEGWPERAAEITVMDPCMGSGHFLVAAADMLRAMRMEEEGLTQAEAAIAVLRDNLFGLELDPRCTQIAAFALAFDAWKAIGRATRDLPVPNLACSGIAIKGQREDWHKLAKGDEQMTAALDRLYDLFVDAPELGSLIDPRAAANGGQLWSVDPDRLIAALEEALAKEKTSDPAAAVFGGAAAGTAKAARLLSGKYWLVATNVPYLGSADYAASVKNAIDSAFPEGKHDLAYAMLLRAVPLLVPKGSMATVAPQAWTYQAYSKAMRNRFLSSAGLCLVGRIGAHGFETISGEVVNVALTVVRVPPSNRRTVVVDANGAKSASGKSELLRASELTDIDTATAATGEAINFSGAIERGVGLGELVTTAKGVCTGDFPRFGRKWWEVPLGPRWVREQTASSLTKPTAGLENALLWEGGQGALIGFVRERLGGREGAWIRGQGAWSKRGVAISRVSGLQATLYSGELFDDSIGVLVPQDESHLAALWAYCTSPDFSKNVRSVNQKLSVDNTYLKMVPFDVEHWQQVAAEQYPNGLPEPYSDNPTQWLFKGTVMGSEAPLQVAVARLLGYRWPDQEPDELDELADRDGIVCLPSVGGDPPAHERLERLLGRAYGAGWTPSLRTKLLADAGSPGSDLASWLRDDFFSQHAKLFHNRPFIWQVWDGRKDGFSALVHYHRLDRATLEKLTYTGLNDWIERQREGVRSSEPGADARLAAAIELQRKLKLILDGEPPYDIYVRWKTLAEQPIGWQPDLDDGVRLNIRPFVAAGILRSKFTINWNKDRGRDPDGAERHNDQHYTIAEKRAARAAVGEGRG
jgi:hypothetical protein